MFSKEVPRDLLLQNRPNADGFKTFKSYLRYKNWVQPKTYIVNAFLGEVVVPVFEGGDEGGEQPVG